jgi:hypothetical protein
MDAEPWDDPLLTRSFNDGLMTSLRCPSARAEMAAWIGPADNLSVHSGGTTAQQYAKRLDSSVQDLQNTWERPGDTGWLTAGLIQDAATSQRVARGRPVG